MKFGNSYHESVFTPHKLKKTVNRVAKKIVKLQKQMEFDAIVVTGLSGAGIGFPVSYLTGIPCIYVRKSTKQTHGEMVEGPNKDVKRYLILDDFIVSGDTIQRVVKTIQKEAYDKTKPIQCCGVFCYASKRMTIERMTIEKIDVKIGKKTIMLPTFK